MTIDRAGTVTGTNSLGAPTTQSSTNDMGKDAFMRLLVTQIRNQDPMDPMDSRELMTQLSQLTSVEKLVAIDDRLAGLQVATAGVANTQASDLLGKVVRADTSSVHLTEGAGATGAYTLDGDAQNVRVTITDGDGHVVRTMDLGATHAGQQGFTWDGKDDAGVRAPEGSYRVTIAATSESGGSVPARTEIEGMVSSLTFDDGFPELNIGSTSVRMGDIRSIGQR